MQGERSAVKGGDAWSPRWASPENEGLISKFAQNQEKIHKGCSVKERRSLIEANRSLRIQILGPDHSRFDRMTLETLARHFAVEQDKDDHVHGTELSSQMGVDRLARSVTAAGLQASSSPA